MLFHKVSKHLGLVFLVGHLDKLIFLPFELLSDRDLVLKLQSCRLEFLVDIAVSNGIETFFNQHFSPCAFDLLYQQFLLCKVFIVS